MIYDLEERTAKFGENIIDLCRLLSADHVTRPLITQLIRSSTSIGANYMEANGASSKKDFVNKIRISRREAAETKHWLRMLKRCFPARGTEINQLWDESNQLTLIFQKVIATSIEQLIKH